MSVQVAADLRAAADVLERDGWTQGDYEYEGRHCASGAIALVASRNRTAAPGRLDFEPEFERWSAAVRRLREAVGNDSVAAFNDEPGRTAAEVIAALRDAADRAEATA